MAEQKTQEQMAQEFAQKIYEKGSMKLAEDYGRVHFDLTLARTQLDETQEACRKLSEELQNTKAELEDLKHQLAAKKAKEEAPKDMEIGG